MNKQLSWSCCVGVVFLCNTVLSGQQRVALPLEVNSHLIGEDLRNQRSTEETVFFPSFGDECALELVTLGIENQWGRVSGMNGFGDLEKAQALRFEGSESFRIVGAMVWFERPAVDGDGTIVIKVYEPREIDGRPDRLLGQSDAIKVSEVVTSDSIALPTIFTFDQTAPIVLNNPEFILSCDFFNLYQTFDTLVMLQTITECGDGGDSWELLFGGEIWLNIASEFSWQLNADWAMAAVVDFDDPTNSNEFIRLGNLRLYPVIPNPAEQKVEIRFANKHSEFVQIDVFDAAGAIIRHLDLNRLTAGEHRELLDVSKLPMGIYYYRITSGLDAITSRFIKQ